MLARAAKPGMEGLAQLGESSVQYLPAVAQAGEGLGTLGRSAANLTTMAAQLPFIKCGAARCHAPCASHQPPAPAAAAGAAAAAAAARNTRRRCLRQSAHRARCP